MTLAQRMQPTVFCVGETQYSMIHEDIFITTDFYRTVLPK